MGPDNGSEFREELDLRLERVKHTSASASHFEQGYSTNAKMGQEWTTIRHSIFKKVLVGKWFLGCVNSNIRSVISTVSSLVGIRLETVCQKLQHHWAVDAGLWGETDLNLFSTRVMFLFSLSRPSRLRGREREREGSIPGQEIFPRRRRGKAADAEVNMPL